LLQAPHKQRARDLYDAYDEEYQRSKIELELSRSAGKSAVERVRKMVLKKQLLMGF